MKRIAVIAIAVLLLSFFSAEASAGGFWFGAYGGSVIPVGGFGDYSAIGLSVGAGLGLWLGDRWLISAYGAYDGFGRVDFYDETYRKFSIKGTAIPVQLGLSYYFGEPEPLQFYLTARAGVYFWGGDYAGENLSGYFNSQDPGVAGGLGIAIPVTEERRTSLYLELDYNAVFGEDTQSFLGILVGLNFTR